MSVQLPSTITSNYFEEWDKLLNCVPDRSEATLWLLRNEYSFDILGFLAQIDSLHREICIILREFEARSYGLFKFITIEQLMLNVKFYVISWTTLTDMIAALINRVFNLGFADGDVKFDLVLRNKHVQKSQLPTIFEKYKKSLDIKHVKRHRNEIVHRGRIIDEEIVTFYKNQNVLHASRYSLLRTSHISEEEYKKETAKQAEILFELASRRKAFYEAHYKSTLEMVAEVLASLAQKAYEQYKTRAI